MAVMPSGQGEDALAVGLRCCSMGHIHYDTGSIRYPRVPFFVLGILGHGGNIRVGGLKVGEICCCFLFRF